MKIEYIQRITQLIQDEKKAGSISKTKKNSQPLVKTIQEPVVHIYKYEDSGPNTIILDKKGKKAKYLENNKSKRQKEEEKRKVKKYECNGGVFWSEEKNNEISNNKLESILEREDRSVQVVVVGSDVQAKRQLVKGVVDGSEQGIVTLITQFFYRQGYSLTLHVLAINHQHNKTISQFQVLSMQDVSHCLKNCYFQQQNIGGHLVFNITVKNNSNNKSRKVQIVQLDEDNLSDVYNPSVISEYLVQFNQQTYPNNSILFIHCLPLQATYQSLFLSLEAFKDLQRHFQPHFQKLIQIEQAKSHTAGCSTQQQLDLEQLQENLDVLQNKYQYTRDKYKQFKNSYQALQNSHSKEIARLHQKVLQEQQATVKSMDSDSQYRINKLLIQVQEQNLKINNQSLKLQCLQQEHNMSQLKIDSLKANNATLHQQVQQLKAKEKEYMNKHYDFQEQQETVFNLQQKVHNLTINYGQCQEDFRKYEEEKEREIERLKERQRENSKKELNDYRMIQEQLDGLLGQQEQLHLQNKHLHKENQEAQGVIQRQDKQIIHLHQQIKQIDQQYEQLL